jgi:hypothetical protein
LSAVAKPAVKKPFNPFVDPEQDLRVADFDTHHLLLYVASFT